MVILTLLDPQHKTPLRQWQFLDPVFVRVGRAPENHVVLSDPAVSRHHLELRRVDRPISATETETCWQVVNYSGNGTLLNGAIVSQSLICQDSTLQLAKNGPILTVQLRDRLPSSVLVAPSSDPSHCTHDDNAPENLFCVHCGQPLQVLKQVRRYQILRVLGRGGMGTTYLAWHSTGRLQPSGRPQGRILVLKEMNASIAHLPKAQELFEREARTLKSLTHSGVPRFFDFFIEDEKKYLVMERIYGQDLEQWVRQRGSVPLSQAIAWMRETCLILDYLHRRPVPIIHRDIKPANLMVRQLTQQIVILDFGAVKEVGAPPGTRIGAEGYSAPEQVQGRPATQSDLYAAAASLVFLLTGKSPRHFYQKTAQGYRLVLNQVPAIPASVQAVIQQATAPNVGDRYATAADMAAALARC